MIELLKSPVFVQYAGIAAVVVVVGLFMRFLEKRDKAFEQIHREHIDERAMCRQALSANAVASTATAVASERTVTALNNLAHVITISANPQQPTT